MHFPRSVSVRTLAAAAAVSGFVTANLKLNTSISDNYIPLDHAVPELTGQVSVPGFRLDKPFGTADSEVDGWTLQINMTGKAAGRAANHFVARLKPPAPPAEGAVWDVQTGEWLVADDVSATWGLQFVGLFDTEFPLPLEGNNAEDGSCPDSVFSEQCRRDYIQAILDPAVGVFGYIMSPDSCKGFASLNLIHSIRTESYFSSGTLFSWRYNGPVWHNREALTAEHIKFNCVKADRNATTGELLVPGPSDDNTTTTPTGSNTPTPTAGASLPAVWFETVVTAVVIVALGMNMF